MTRKHNVSSIISDKLYCTIKDAIEYSLGFELHCYDVKVNDQKRIVTFSLPPNFSKDYSGGWVTDVDCREAYFIPFCDNFYHNWKTNPFKSIEFDDDTLMITLHFDTDNTINELEVEMEDLKDDEILICRNCAWLITHFDDKDFNECFLDRFYFDGFKF